MLSHFNSDGLTSPIERNYPLINFQDTQSGAGYEGPSHNYAPSSSPITNPPSPGLDPQSLPDAPARTYGQEGLEPGYGDDYDSGRLHRVVSPATLEPSPMLQAMTQYAADPLPQIDYINESHVDTYSQDANTLEASPIFAYATPPPTRETVLPSSSHTSTPAHQRS
ncbi:hypothetical protein FS749_005524 [Ceratobasidium sp. UAMH 11750]|nr:hypothetical protein FS749_005524 [Ceratobasidium sp. UAMH 11750]